MPASQEMMLHATSWTPATSTTAACTTGLNTPDSIKLELTLANKELIRASLMLPPHGHTPPTLMSLDHQDTLAALTALKLHSLRHP